MPRQPTVLRALAASFAILKALLGLSLCQSGYLGSPRPTSQHPRKPPKASQMECPNPCLRQVQLFEFCNLDFAVNAHIRNKSDPGVRPCRRRLIVATRGK